MLDGLFYNIAGENNEREHRSAIEPKLADTTPFKLSTTPATSLNHTARENDL